MAVVVEAVVGTFDYDVVYMIAQSLFDGNTILRKDDIVLASMDEQPRYRYSIGLLDHGPNRLAQIVHKRL